MTCVYIIECAGRVKIGVANDPRSRLKELNIGSPDPARLVGTREFTSRAVAFEIESRMHRILRARQVKGEWFDIPADEAWALLKKQRPLRLINPKARHDSAARWQDEAPADLTNILTRPVQS